LEGSKDAVDGGKDFGGFCVEDVLDTEVKIISGILTNQSNKGHNQWITPVFGKVCFDVLNPGGIEGKDYNEALDQGD